MNFRPWLIARVLVIAAAVAIGLDHEPSGMTWRDARVTSSVVGVGVFVQSLWIIYGGFTFNKLNVDWSNPFSLTRSFWLTRHPLDWSDPFSLTKSFWLTHPVRFYLLMSAYCLSLGIFSLIEDLITTKNIRPFTGAWILSGASILIASLAALSVEKRKRRK